ncbi:MAG: hypothetical protein DMG21_10325, partial [Acidobacteria bacterium]
YTKITVLDTFDSAAEGGAEKSHGEVRVNTQVVGFKKIKFGTMENVGSGVLSLPEQEMHTTAYWLTLHQTLLAALPYNSDERMEGVRGLARAIEAIATLLLMCDARDLGVTIGENCKNEYQKSETRNQKSEEGSQESEVRSQESEAKSESAETEAAGAEAGINELRVSNFETRASKAQARVPSPQSAVPVLFEPNIYLYDKYPGGVGFSEPLFRISGELLANARRLIENCACPSGCPSCVGPAGEVGEKGKEVALAILKELSVVTGP